MTNWKHTLWLIFVVMHQLATICPADSFVEWDEKIKAGQHAFEEYSIQKAKSEFEAALAIARKSDPPEILVIQATTHLARAQIWIGEYDKARASLIQVTALAKKFCGEKSVEYGRAMVVKGELYKALKIWDLAELYLSKGVECLKVQYPAGEETLDRAGVQLAYLLAQAGKYDEAFKVEKSTRQKHVAITTLEVRQFLQREAFFAYLAVRTEDDNFLRVKIDRLARSNWDNSPRTKSSDELAKLYAELGKFHVAKKEYNNATAKFERALEIYHGIPSLPAVECANLHLMTARVHTISNNTKEARSHFKKAVEVIRDSGIVSHSDFAVVYREYGQALLILKEQQEADHFARLGKEMTEKVEQFEVLLRQDEEKLAEKEK